MTALNIVTAVSRPGNLIRILDSIEKTAHLSGLDVKWITIFDAPADAPPDVQERFSSVKSIRIKKDFWLGGPVKFGILQKNLGIDLCDDGFYYLLDDDNVVHPSFFERIGQLIASNQGKLAFAFNQKRWDFHGDLPARPDRMVPGKIDNSMFVVHTSLIGAARYDLGLAGTEDGHFFQGLFRKNPETFVFVDEYLAYYNYITHFPKG